MIRSTATSTFDAYRKMNNLKTSEKAKAFSEVLSVLYSITAG